MKIFRIALFAASLLPLQVMANDVTYQVCSTVDRPILLQQGFWEEEITQGSCYPKDFHTSRGAVFPIIIQLDKGVNLRVKIPSESFKGKTTFKLLQIERTNEDCNERRGGQYVNAKIIGQVTNQDGEQPLSFHTCVRK